MDNSKAALNMMRKNCFMASIDLSDAYYSVPVALTEQNIYYLNLRDNYANLFAYPMVYPLHQQLSLNY